VSILSQVTSGKQIGAQIHTIVGDNGVGKTTFVASFPNVLILDLENGSKHLDVTKLSAEKFPDLKAFRECLTALKDSEHEYKTIGIDSVEALEILIFKSVCADAKVDSIEDVGGGYGKGYVRSREVMTEIMQDLQALQRKGITCILVAHSQIKPKVDPILNQTYDRMVMRCNDKMAAIIRDLSDNVFYATYKVLTTKEGNKTKAYGDGQRVMYTGPRPGFDAKNRLELPYELPLSYEAFIDACENNEESDPGALINDINEMTSALDEKMKKVVAEQLEKFKNNPSKLKQVKDRLMKYVAGAA
jgi:hypothetical protein